MIYVVLQSEYVSARDKRREFVSGFTGSAGQYAFMNLRCYLKEFDQSWSLDAYEGVLI